MIFKELDITEKNIGSIIFLKIYLKNGVVIENARGVMITDTTITLATKIHGEIANQLIILRSEICAVEYGEIRLNKKVYY